MSEEGEKRTRFDDLCASYAAARQSFFDYRDRHVAVAGKVVRGLVEYLGCPRGQVVCLLPAEEDEEHEKGPLPAAIRLGEDGSWHLRVGVTVYQSPTTFPQERLVLTLVFKQTTEGRFAVQVADMTSTRREIHPDDQSAVAALSGALFDLISSHYRAQKRFYDGGQGEDAGVDVSQPAGEQQVVDRIIGFRLPKN